MKTSSILLGLTLAAVSVSAAPRFGGQTAKGGATAAKGAAASKGGAAAVSYLLDLFVCARSSILLL